MKPYFSDADLLQTPAKRSAYSDRTAYMMAEMSRLAYFRFEGGHKINDIMDSINEIYPEGEKLQAIQNIIKTTLTPDDVNASKTALDNILKEHEFELVETFNSTEGAQAFLCVNSKKNIAVLSFRGTELNLKDIKADVKANLIEVKVGNKKVEIHSGYYGQFESIQAEIEKALLHTKITGKQLFITGHSLGGALAITATRFLANDMTGACYTFGSPPVGTANFDLDVTTPIYRIINHVDIVPRLPSPVLVLLIRCLALALGIILDLFGGLSKTIRNQSWFIKASNLLNDAKKYRQSGYGSYLVGEGKNSRLRYSVSIVDRFWWWLYQLINIFHGEFKLLSDHSIDNYSNKLAAWAVYRQNMKKSKD